MKIFTSLALLFGSASALADLQLISGNEYKFMGYITKFGKTYKTVAEYKLRLAIYEKRIAEHKAHNEEEGATSSQGEN